MTEQQIEALEKVFPDGFVAIGKMPNGSYHVYLFNMDQDMVIDGAHDNIADELGLVEIEDDGDDTPSKQRHWIG
jgi:hypothetical protein